MYKLTEHGQSIVRLSDNASIPRNVDNPDYREFLQWEAEGNVPLPAFTDEELLERAKVQLEQAVQVHLDATARARGYDSILSACSYASAPNRFQMESQAFIEWRSACWDMAFQVQQEVAEGTRPVPTEEELISLLPVFEFSQ